MQFVPGKGFFRSVDSDWETKRPRFVLIAKACSL